MPLSTVSMRTLSFSTLVVALEKPCMHMSYKVGCRSYGLEMENVRHQACIEALLLLS